MFRGERRDFLEAISAGGVAGAALAGLSGCFRALGDAPATVALDDDALAARLRQLDVGLEAPPTRQFISEVVLEGSTDGLDDDALTRFVEDSDELSRRMLRALLFLAFYIELPTPTKEHPEVQRRIEQLSPELEQALSDSATLLATFPVDELEQVDHELRETPELMMRLCESMDRCSRDLGPGRPSRRLLRAAARRLSNGQRALGMRAVIDEGLSALEQALLEADADPTELYRRADVETILALFDGDGGARQASSKSPEQGQATDQPQSEPVSASPPCVELVDEFHRITGDCYDETSAPTDEALPAELRPIRPYDARDQRAEYDHWRRVSNPEMSEEANERRYRIGRNMTIAGAVLIVACGVGLLVLIPGLIVLGAAARRRRQYQQGESP